MENNEKIKILKEEINYFKTILIKTEKDLCFKSLRKNNIFIKKLNTINDINILKEILLKEIYYFFTSSIKPLKSSFFSNEKIDEKTSILALIIRQNIRLLSKNEYKIFLKLKKKIFNNSLINLNFIDGTKTTIWDIERLYFLTLYLRKIDPEEIKKWKENDI